MVARHVVRYGTARAVTGLLCASSLLVACSHGVPRSTGAVPPAANGADIRVEAAVAGTAPADPTPTGNRGSLSIVTSPERETDFQAGLDLARYVAAPAGLTLDVLSSKGATDNMHRLRDDPTVDLAIVQYDVLKAFTDEAARGSAAAERIVKPLRVVAPLYTEEMYFIVRRETDLQSVDQIRDRRINLGAVGSGSAVSVAALYRQLFGKPIAAVNASYLDEQRALVALTVDRTVDVVVVIAGQPARLLADMKPEARRYIKLLPVDRALASSRSAYKGYFPSTIRKANYAQWLDADVPTFSVLSFLVTSSGKGDKADERLAAFSRSLCRNFVVLRDVVIRSGARWTSRRGSVVDGPIRRSAPKRSTDVRRVGRGRGSAEQSAINRSQEQDNDVLQQSRRHGGSGVGGDDGRDGDGGGR